MNASEAREITAREFVDFLYSNCSDDGPFTHKTLSAMIYIAQYRLLSSVEKEAGSGEKCDVCIIAKEDGWEHMHADDIAKVESGDGLPPSSMAIEPMVGAWDLVDAIATGDEKSRFIAAELQQYRKASIVTNEAGHKEVKKILDQLKYALEENELLKSRIRDLERVYELGKNGNRSEAMTCPLPLHNPLRQKDGTYKCSGCGKTWDEYPTVKVTYPKGKR